MSKKANVPKVIHLENTLSAKTRGQKDYIRSIVESKIVLCTGVPGAGKTYLSVGMGCELLARGEVSSLMFSRPIVGCGKGLAALPGTVHEKISPYFYPVIDCLEFFLGRAQYRNLMASDTIQFVPLELMRGMSIKDTYVSLDEASNAELHQLKMFFSRFDKGSKFVLTGDYKQCDLKKCDFANVVEKMRHSNIEGVSFCELTEEDVQRPKLINDVMHVLEKIDV